MFCVLFWNDDDDRQRQKKKRSFKTGDIPQFQNRPEVKYKKTASIASTAAQTPEIGYWTDQAGTQITDNTFPEGSWRILQNICAVPTGDLANTRDGKNFHVINLSWKLGFTIRAPSNQVNRSLRLVLVVDNLSSALPVTAGDVFEDLPPTPAVPLNGASADANQPIHAFPNILTKNRFKIIFDQIYDWSIGGPIGTEGAPVQSSTFRTLKEYKALDITMNAGSAATFQAITGKNVIAMVCWASPSGATPQNFGNAGTCIPTGWFQIAYTDV